MSPERAFFLHNDASSYSIFCSRLSIYLARGMAGLQLEAEVSVEPDEAKEGEPP